MSRNDALDMVERLAVECLQARESRHWFKVRIEALEFFDEYEVDELIESYRGYWR